MTHYFHGSTWSVPVLLLVGLFLLSQPTRIDGFFTTHPSVNRPTPFLTMTASSLMEPSVRDAKYGDNMAQYLIDLHDSQATFDFCGGMMFQLVLSPALRQYLVNQSQQYSNKNKNDGTTPVLQVAPATAYRMHQLDSYQKTAAADNVAIFHGREIRQVPWAKGGMGFVLHLSLATTEDDNDNEDASQQSKDPEGWTSLEIAGYDGWGHDSGRDWRTGERLEQEGFTNF